MNKSKRLFKIVTKVFFIFHILAILISLFLYIYLIADIGHIPKYNNPPVYEIEYLVFIELIDYVVIVNMLVTFVAWFYMIVLKIAKLINKKFKMIYLYIFLYFTITLIYLIAHFLHISVWTIE
ncbi:MAG: hypothetical protein ACOCWM_02060 [Cyclobacteriaceae bacterium]